MKGKVPTIGIAMILGLLVIGGIAATKIGQEVIGTQGLVHESTSLHLTVILHRPSDTFANYSLWAKGWTPSCYTRCQGVSYTIDPTVLVTDQGRDFEQCKTFGSAGTISCQSADIAQYLSVSVSGGYTPLHGDTACHATVQTSDGYSIIAGTITAGAAGTTVTTTISHTWTDATAAVSNIDLACIQTEASGGGNIVLYAEGQIASTSTNVGDSLETIWTISRT